MNIFISWSGPLSKAIAKSFQDWIEDVLQLTNPWMSEEDIPSGSIWFDDVNEELATTKYGVLIVTERNQFAPWLLWEAGALFGGLVDGSRRKVVPLLTNLKKSELIPPLDKFQARVAVSKKDMLALVKNINADLEKSIADQRLNEQFDRCWEKWASTLDSSISNIVDVSAQKGVSNHTFGEATERFLAEKQSDTYGYRLLWAGHYLDSLLLDQVNDDSLALFIKERKSGTCPAIDGKEARGPAKLTTIHAEIAVVIRVLKAAQKWGWLQHLPNITKPVASTARKHFVLTPVEQQKLVKYLPEYLKNVAIFAVNTGADRGILQDLEWSWLKSASGLRIEYFVVPDDYDSRNGGRIILLNSAARHVISKQKKTSSDRFVFEGPRGGKAFVSNAFRDAWKQAGLPQAGGHSLGISNLHWTFVDRLERADVIREDREFLQWRGDLFRENKSTAPDLPHLLNCLEKVATPKEFDH